MAYKLILKDFETLEKNIFFLDSLPEEEALIAHTSFKKSF